MSDLLSTLPKKDDLEAALPTDFSIDGFDTLGSDVTGVMAGLDAETPSEGPSADMDVAVPANLSADRVTSTLQEPLDSMTAFNADSLSAGIANGTLPVEVPEIDFDVNAPMSIIGNALAPSGQASTPNVSEDMPGFDSQEALFQLKKLAAAGAATPMRLVNMYLKIFKTFIDKATDQKLLVKLAVKSLEEIYLGQIQKVGYNLPHAALQDLLGVLDSDLLDRYETLLDDLEASTNIDFDLLERARLEIIPELTKTKRANNTLTHFSNGDVQALLTAIEKLLEFTGEGEVVLQAFFDSFENKVISILEAVKPPIETIKDGAEKVNQFLKDTAAKAEAVATQVATTLEEKLSTVDQFISGDLTDKIKQINDQIDTFLGTVSTQANTVVGSVKGGLSQVTDGVEGFFEKVNDLKAKLEAAVEGAADQVDGKVENGFQLAEQKIRELLDKITDVLESPAVADALSKTKEGIEKFKMVMEEVSLQPVFDLVVTKTGEVEVKVNAIQVDELGVPQKTAIKLGAKIIKEVKVDEIIKPELIAIFKELRDPIAALIDELKKGVLQINQLIDEFAPGTIVRNLIENAGPYQDFIHLLETYKPSVLLAPLKQAYGKLVALVEKLDPNILINQLQGLFNELFQLVEALSPDKLNTMIMSAVGTVTNELRTIKDGKLDQIVATIKDTISLQKLLEGTGIEDIADAEIWRIINYWLGGEFLNKINEALTFVEAEIANRVAQLTFEHHEEEVRQLNLLIDAQLAATKASTLADVKAVNAKALAAKDRIEALEARRKQLLIDLSNVPEYKDTLTKLDLTFLVGVEAVTETIISNESRISANLKAFKKPLTDNREKLKNVDKASLELAAPIFFRKQFSEPVGIIIANTQAELAPFTDAVEAIRQIVITLTELPAKMDENVAKVLDTAVDGIKQVIDSAIDAINLAASTITGGITNTYNTLLATLDKFSPMGLLNTFALTDFEEGGLGAMRNTLRQPPNNDDLAVFLNNKLTNEEQGILNVDDGAWAENVLKALNTGLFDPAMNSHKEAVKAALDLRISELEEEADPNPNQLSKFKSLSKQLAAAGTPTKKQDKIRLNRIILEAMYPTAIKMSLQSLHPFIVAQIEQLYPQELVERLDETYLKIVDKVKLIPQKLIQEPLDDKYNELKTLFQENFDIEGIFKVLQVKLDGMDEDLELGLDRVAYAFNRLIDTLDSRLSE